MENNMDDNLNIQLKKLRDTVRLTVDEKGFHKNEVLRFVANYEPKKKGLLSPFNFHLFPKVKFAVVGMAFLLFFTTGLYSSAKSALPNQYLYVFKIKVVEPVQVFMAWNTEDRNKTRVALIGQRMEDFNQVNIHQNLSAEAKATFAESFSIKIKEVQEEITKQAKEENISVALSTANDLQSVLTAHSVVLDKIRETELKNETVIELKTIMTPDNLAQNINEGIGKTNEIIGDLTAKLQSTEESDNLETALAKQKEDLNASIQEIKSSVEDTVKKNKGQINSDDQEYITKKIAEIEELLKEGDETTEIDNKKQTLNFYNEADQKLGELKTLLGSNQKLGIDVFGESEVEGEIELMNTIVPVDATEE